MNIFTKIKMRWQCNISHRKIRETTTFDQLIKELKAIPQFATNRLFNESDERVKEFLPLNELIFLEKLKNMTTNNPIAVFKDAFSPLPKPSSTLVALSGEYIYLTNEGIDYNLYKQLENYKIKIHLIIDAHVNNQINKQQKTKRKINWLAVGAIATIAIAAIALAAYLK